MIKDNCFKIYYVTPEKFFNESGEPSYLFAHMFACGQIAIDEVHLLRSWESFRPAFKYTIPFCQQCPCSVMALTATATPDVKKELISSLNNPVQTIASVNQPNIFYSVHKLEIQHNDRASQIAKQIIPYLENQEPNMAPLAISLHQAGFKTCSYHGQKMSGHDKMQSMESRRSNAVKIMVCTTAFGLGIDQPDVEVVMRVGCPPTLETMIQEFGRAGRDGRPAKSINGRCRREVLQYFGENKPSFSDWCCDVCECLTEMRDCSAEIKIIVQCVKELPLLGEKSLTIRLHAFLMPQFYNIGKGMSYIPGAASLSCTHRTRIKNIRLTTLRNTNCTVDSRTALLDFEKDAIAFDKSMRDNTEGKHLTEYEKLGHPYVRSYDCIEVDITYRTSIELEYLFNVVAFNYILMRCFFRDGSSTYTT
uniref:DNA 3'-5' helicase n=1 Tax=Amphimedon queenslandica TaxID=400682 RepID=A0A1X7U995_AMPQE